MLTTSSATTSAVQDWVPTDKANLHTSMCILILTKWDGTPFDVTSVLEEDIVKICIWQGHTHPMDELHYLATESIMLFQLANNMQCATHGAIKVMVLHEEAIAVRISPPSTTHMRAYMATVCGEPSRIQPPPSDGEEELYLPTGNHHLPGRMLQHLKADLGDLADGDLCQLMEDLHWEVTLHELNTPQEALHLCLGQTQ